MSIFQYFTPSHFFTAGKFHISCRPTLIHPFCPLLHFKINSDRYILSSFKTHFCTFQFFSLTLHAKLTEMTAIIKSRISFVKHFSQSMLNGSICLPATSFFQIFRAIHWWVALFCTLPLPSKNSQISSPHITQILQGVCRQVNLSIAEVSPQMP